MTPILRAESVRRVYPAKGSQAPRVALDLAGQQFDIHYSEVVGIVGHNGSGKSTLMRMLALLETPDAGRLFMDGTEIWSPPRTFDQLPDILTLRRQITLLLQTPYLLSRSVFCNVAYGLEARSIPETQRTERVHQALLAVGLDPVHFARRRRNELSGGEAQRVALAARLAIQPRILLMDEPTAGVDEASAVLIANAILHSRAQGTAVIIASHDTDWLSPLCTRIVRFKNGVMI